LKGKRSVKGVKIEIFEREEHTHTKSREIKEGGDWVRVKK
jgi:hypothetical protein